MIKVNAVCGWCNLNVETDIESPLPEGWLQKAVISADPDTEYSQETFCGESHYNTYMEYAPQAIREAKKDYTAKFYSKMNEFRAADTKVE